MKIKPIEIDKGMDSRSVSNDKNIDITGQFSTHCKILKAEKELAELKNNAELIINSVINEIKGELK